MKQRAIVSDMEEDSRVSVVLYYSFQPSLVGLGDVVTSRGAEQWRARDMGVSTARLVQKAWCRSLALPAAVAELVASFENVYEEGQNEDFSP